MPSRGLTRASFRPVGVRGCGDPFNSYVHAMEWFQGKLFIGTFRNSLCFMKETNRKVPPPKMEFWPVLCCDTDPADIYCAEIRCWDPATDDWRLLYRAPVVEDEGQLIPRDIGYRGMVTFKGRSDPQPCLYLGSTSRWGAHVLRSEDGERWDVTRVMDGPSIRTLVPFNGVLYTAIVGQRRTAGNESSHREVWASDDPANGEWYPASKPGFGDEANVSLFEMCVFGEHLYVGTMNPISGFEIWKSRCEGRPPHRWTRVLGSGAYRGFLNEFALSMCVFNGALYVGSGIAGGGYDRLRKVGPGPAELIRIHPDDSWDLVVGAARATPDGLKVPLSGRSAGFDHPLNGYFWRMCVHEDHLYMGTFNGTSFAAYKPHGLAEQSPELRKLWESFLPTESYARFIELYGGCHLWRTRDGERFGPVTRDGFGTPYNVGVRQMASTPVGLFVGTANPFGPKVAVHQDGEWSYADNPRGGCEVHLGSAELEPVPPERHPERARDRQERHALHRLGAWVDHIDQVLSLDELYERSGFSQIGYWKDAPASCKEAGEALVEALIDMTTDMAPDRRAPVLEVCCGRGATTRRLLDHFAPSEVTCIDEVGLAIDVAAERLRGVRVLAMDPARLEFPDASFGLVVCAEGAGALDTRRDFWKEAARVLVPGGRLVMADLVFSKQAVRANRRRFRPNYVRNLDLYRSQLVSAGFDPSLEIRDVTADTVGPFLAHVASVMTARFRALEITEAQLASAMAAASRRVMFVERYLLVCASKP